MKIPEINTSPESQRIPNRRELQEKVGASVKFGKKVMDWFKNLFKSDKTGKESAPLVGSFLGFLASLGFEKGKEKKDTPKDEREKLRQEVEQSTGFEAIRNDTSLTPAQKIIKTAELIKERGILSKDCGDFMEKVYRAAGYKKTEIFRSKIYNGKVCEDCAKEANLNKIESGDWLWLNNKNAASDRGNHSVIFLGWLNKERYLAKVTGFYAKGESFGTYNVTLRRPSENEKPEKGNCWPVTAIYKPV